jgi:hypothetical protein
MTLETGALIPEWPHESARNSFRNEFPLQVGFKTEFSEPLRNTRRPHTIRCVLANA